VTKLSIRKDANGYVEGALMSNSKGEIYKIGPMLPNGDFQIFYQYRGTGKEWHSYGQMSLKRLQDEYVLTPNGAADLQTAYEEVVLNTDKYDTSQDEEADTTTTTLASSTSLSNIQQMQRVLAEKQQTVDMAIAFMERQKSIMESLTRGLAEQIRKLQKIIDAIEMYLGTNASVVEIQTGRPIEGPIQIRQAILYMDEEYGDPRPNPKTGQKGLDFQCVEDFDAWLLANIDKIMAEKKGILAMKPSRQKRSYSDNVFLNASINEKNSMTYLIIRNGENIYRLWTNIVFGRRMFPTQEEMEVMFKTLDSDRVTSWDKEKVIDAEYVFKRNALIIQGLIDRTDFFKPLDPKANLFRPETYEGNIDLIRDDENILHDGRLSWKEWRLSVNKQIDVGSRVLFINPNYIHHGYETGKEYSSRYLVYSSRDNLPPLPTTGVYQIERKMEKKEYWQSDKRWLWFFWHNPGDEVWSSAGWRYDPHTRKNRVAFGIRPDDDFVINYDQIELSDIEYYLNVRRDKSEYVEFVMTLWTLRDRLEEEHIKELDFVNLIAGRLDVSLEVVWEAVTWWKFKNKWKRPISKDDAKALRMIERRLNKIGKA
jgi:hypothetical protein